MMHSGSRGWAQGTQEASEIMYSPVLRHRVCVGEQEEMSIAFGDFPEASQF